MYVIKNTAVNHHPREMLFESKFFPNLLKIDWMNLLHVNVLINTAKILNLCDGFRKVKVKKILGKI
tara:strand:- start:1503 stop:1700 length:198 start_codon:yes stop_codon:yes gene_type:complete